MKLKNKVIIIILSLIVLLCSVIPAIALSGSFSYETTYQLADITCTGSITAAKARCKVEIELNNPDCNPQSDYSGKVWMRGKNTYDYNVFTSQVEGTNGQLSVEAVRIVTGFILTNVHYKHYVNGHIVFENDLE